MKSTYSVKKGLKKGLLFILNFAIVAVGVLGVSDVNIWDLVVEYIKPVVGGLTFGGLLIIVQNFVKYNWMPEGK